MKAIDFILYLFWDQKCDLVYGTQKVQVKKRGKQSFFHKPYNKMGRVREEEIKSVCKDLGIPEPK